MPLKFYNTATRTIEEFTPLPPHTVTMYNCGPTVYNYAHIGNLRAYVFADVLRRTLEMNGYAVKQVINITDVGHLVGDGDEGEDKVALGAQREGKSVEEIITHYSEAFFADLKALNILPASVYPRASAPEYIAAQKDLIERLAQKGHTYTTSDGIYFDTNKFPHYADFAKLDVLGMRAGTRVDMGEKKHPTDFALWKFSPSDGAQREQEWDSPCNIPRKGFPGWHIECSAIIEQTLGTTIDIHTGGIDHIPVHHTNEIAQSESAHDAAPLAHFWMHSAFMNVDGQKMSKSLGNTYTLADLEKHGISPMAFRYWLLTAHYRTQANFTWEALLAANTAYHRLCNILVNFGNQIGRAEEQYVKTFSQFINDDLNTPAAVALIWDMVKDTEVSTENKLATIFQVDQVLGLRFEEKHNSVKHLLYPPPIANLLSARKLAREEKNFAESDRLRDELKKLGYEVGDTPLGQQLEKI